MIPQTISHYRILDQIGAGGMGEVYLAEDRILGRKVALKLLPPRFTSDVDRLRRFAQEARAASALNHPNIITIYEVGEADGLHFIATEFVEGTTLRKLLRGRRVAIIEAIEISTQVAAALTAAGTAGLAHRDIKPENIMVRPDGYVKVLDFGLAKLIEPSVPTGDEDYETRTTALNETDEGVVLGTATYMSPEQARGQRIDARTDIFSLGVVLYELIAGHPPFAGESKNDIIAEILRNSPPSLASQAREAMPSELDLIISKMLAKDRDKRYQTALGVWNDLKRLQRKLALETETGDAADTSRLSASENAGVVEDTGPNPVVVPTKPMRRRRSRRMINSLAVLPFSSVSADSNAGFLSDGITESIINNLSRLPRLRVMARSTVYRYKGHMVDAQVVGRELDVRAVLTGRVVLAADRLLVKVELVDADDGSQLWGEQFSRPLADVFVIEEQISHDISTQLRLRLTGDERKQLARRHTKNSDAYQAYLKGRYYWNQRTAPGLKKAIECFEQAIAFDANYALAYAGLADSYSLLGIYSAIPPRSAMPKTRTAALRALEIDDTLAEAHTALAGAYAFFDWDWAGAEREFLRAIQLNPASALAHHWYASVYLTAMGRFDEALAEEQRAKEIEPLSLVINTHLGWICYHARKYEQAIAFYNQALELDENFISANFYQGLAYLQQGRFDEGIGSLDKAVRLSGRGPMIVGVLGYAYARAGDGEGARRVLAELREQSGRGYISPFYYALIHTGLGETSEALDWMERTWEERFCWLVWLRTEPMLDPLREDPRFADLLRRVNLQS